MSMKGKSGQIALGTGRISWVWDYTVPKRVMDLRWKMMETSQAGPVRHVDKSCYQPDVIGL